MITVALFFTLVLPTLSTAQATASFPLRLSANGRYLVDAGGAPFLIHGDAGWSLIVQLTNADTDFYLEDRRQKGYNTVIANLLESFYSSNPPKNVYGEGPFTTPGDFATPNEAYFAHVDWVLSKAAEKGIVLFLNPAYAGYAGTSDTINTDGWTAEIVNNGPTKCRNYGRYLGNRYKNFNNIVWVAGGDRTLSATATTSALEILRGIKDFAPTHLWTAHWNNDMNSMDVPAFRPYMDLNGIYAYEGKSGYVHQRSLPQYNLADFKPIYLWESWYEGLNWSGIVTPRATVRRQAYETNLSGSTGEHSGSNFVYVFGGPTGSGATYNWRDNLSSPSTLDMGFVRQLFANRPWQLLEPDQFHTAVTGGYGTFGQSNYVTAARTSDGSLVMAYVPSTGTGVRSLTVDLSKLSGVVTAQWYNPTNGTYSDIAGSPLANSGSQTFATPGNNGSGTNDWVLVLSGPAVILDPPSPPSGLRVK